MSDHFNALQYARQLEATGVPKNQAEVHANTLAQVLDNYADLNDLKREVASAVSATETRLRAEIAASEARLEGKIAAGASALSSEMAGVETRLSADIRILRAELTRLRWMNGVVIALSIAILAQGYFD
jgi:phage host-nuclease inhibitor protein Gam